MKATIEIIAWSLGCVTLVGLGVCAARILIEGICNLIEHLHGYQDGFKDGYKSATIDLSRGKNPEWRNSVCTDCAYFHRDPVFFGGVPDPIVTHPRCQLGVVTFLDLEDISKHHACPEWQPRENETNRDKSHETAPICQ